MSPPSSPKHAHYPRENDVCGHNSSTLAHMLFDLVDHLRDAVQLLHDAKVLACFPRSLCACPHIDFLTRFPRSLLLPLLIIVVKELPLWDGPTCEAYRDRAGVRVGVRARARASCLTSPLSTYHTYPPFQSRRGHHRPTARHCPRKRYAKGLSRCPSQGLENDVPLAIGQRSPSYRLAHDGGSVPDEA